MVSRSAVKSVIVHIGPHKTGSTAIQQCLSANRLALSRNDVCFLHDKSTHDAALHLARERYAEAEAALTSVARDISMLDTSTVIISQEDFCGDLPGRTRQRGVYSKLTKHLRIIFRSLQPHQVKFVFIERDETEWLRSCYHQHLKHRTHFSSFYDFQAHFTSDQHLHDRLIKPKETFGESFVVVPYSSRTDAGVRALLEIAGRPSLDLAMPPTRRNVSPSDDLIRVLERINSLSGFKETAWFAKSLILNAWRPHMTREDGRVEVRRGTGSTEVSFPDLTLRALGRISVQDIDDILPEEDVDLTHYLYEILPREAELPAVSRSDIRDQSRVLDYHFRGKSQLAQLNALAISYLRRETTHTRKARTIFHRVWDEHGLLLINELTTRWLISTLQTYLDHGKNEAQRLIGSAGYFYANMLKIYEGERAIEGREQDAVYDATEAQTSNRFAGLDRYSVGGTDLLLNTNAILLDLAMRDDVAGLVLQELLLRVKHSGNVFTRMDKTRLTRGIEVVGFEDTWSFFAPPE